MIRLVPLAAGLVMIATVLAGCALPGVGRADDVDQLFIDMMTPHHQGAVEMARIAQQRAERPEIRQLADAIVAAQTTEIEQLKRWRRDWYGSETTPPLERMPMLPGMATTGHGGTHTSATTMDMAADVAALRTASPPFDRAFIDAMIEHHQSAIDAARIAQDRARRPEITSLARQIIADQQREIEQMRSWRQAWYGSVAP